MSNSLSGDDARAIWQRQPISLPVSLENCVRKYARARARRRVLIVAFTIMCIGIVVGLAAAIADLHTLLERIGTLLTAMGTGYVLSQVHELWSESSEAGLTAGRPDRASVDHCRAELARIRDFSRGRIFWSRYLMLIPGYLILFVGIVVANPGELAPKIMLAVALAASISAVPLNIGGARRIQRRIEILTRALEEKP